MTKALLIVFFVIPIIALTAFGVVSAIMMSDAEKMRDAEKRKVSTNG